jgi:hypothetical protein
MVELSEPYAIARAVLGKSSIDIELTWLAARLFAESVRCLQYKKSRRQELSSTTYVLTAFLYIEGKEDLTEETEESLIRDALFASGLSPAQFRQMAQDFFTTLPTVPAESLSEFQVERNLADVELGPGFTAVLSEWKSERTLAGDVIVNALTQNPETGFAKRVQEALKSSENEVAQPPPGPAPPSSASSNDDDDTKTSPDSRSQVPGRHARIVREASLDELGLNATEYAKALATILRAAEGEFSFALFGKWGSGKTTLLKPLRPLLESSDEYRKIVAAPRSEKYANLRYKVVVHNAWKYRNPPEAWIYLYKSLATAAAASANALDRWALSSRVAANRWGFLSLLVSLALLAVSLIPIQAKMQLLSLLVSAVGASTVIYFVAIWMGAAAKVKQLFRRNLSLAGHDDSLGMLALIGDDVRLLLKGWTKGGANDTNRWQLVGPLVCVFLVASIWGIGLALGYTFDLSALLARIAVIEKPSVSNFTVADATHWIVLALWLILATVLISLPLYSRERRPDKVLLVVDDLDRCTPSEMLSVIENVRLLLDDVEINKRMQVLMLVDESVLIHAITLRYETMIKERSRSLGSIADADEIAASEIVSEQIEKLFACYLRLSRLSDDDVVELVTNLAGYENKIAAKRELQENTEGETWAQRAYDNLAKGVPLARVPEDGPSKHRPHYSNPRMMDTPFWMSSDEVRDAKHRNLLIESENAQLAAMTQEQRLKSRPDVVERYERAKKEKADAQRRLSQLETTTTKSTNVPSRAPFSSSDVRFSDEEIEVLKGFVPRYLKAIGRTPSPRSIKAFLFKLQLSRLLMQIRYPFLDDGEKRMEELLRAFQIEEDSTVKDQADPYTAIVRQVL